MAKFFNVMGFVIIIAMIIFLLPAMVLPRFGMQLYEVLTGSMEPYIPTGSLICISQADGSDIEIGDVVTYYGGGLDKDTVVTHRVVANDTEKKELITKGDANSVEDPYPIPYGQVMGVVSWHVPVLGSFYGFFSGMTGRIVAFVGIVIGILCFFVEDILKKKKTNI